MTWVKKKKKTREREREAASFPLHRLLLPFPSPRVLFKTYSWEEPMHLNFMTAVQAPNHQDDQQRRYIVFTRWVHKAALTSDQNTDFPLFPPIRYRLDMT